MTVVTWPDMRSSIPKNAPTEVESFDKLSKTAADHVLIDMGDAHRAVRVTQRLDLGGEPEDGDRGRNGRQLRRSII